LLVTEQAQELIHIGGLCLGLRQALAQRRHIGATGYADEYRSFLQIGRQRNIYYLLEGFLTVRLEYYVHVHVFARAVAMAPGIHLLDDGGPLAALHVHTHVDVVESERA